jgi:hypothetical protein
LFTAATATTTTSYTETKYEAADKNADELALRGWECHI